jgi:hypothetical protein
MRKVCPSTRLLCTRREDFHKATISDQNIRTIVEKNTRILKTSNRKDDDNGAYNINNLLFSGQ